MATVLGPIGFSWAAIGVVLNTAPAIKKATGNYRERQQQIHVYKIRVASYKAKYGEWQAQFARIDLGQEQVGINAARNSINNLFKDLDKKLANLGRETSREAAGSTRAKWKQIKRNAVEVGRGMGYAVFNKQELEEKIASLEKAIDSVEARAKSVLKQRRAGHDTKGRTEDEPRRVLAVRKFLTNLKSLADDLYYKCTDEATTRKWALGLRSPDELKSIKRWNGIAELDIDLLFFKSGGQGEREFCLRVSHLPEEAQPPIPWRDVILGHSGSPPNVTCTERSLKLRRTACLGKLFQGGHFDSLVVEKTWKEDRARLIHGLTNWVLFLWDTEWTAELCCYGLQLERGAVDQDPVEQMFTSKTHNGSDCNHASSRLRNLGLVIAELVLATPLRFKKGSDNPNLEQMVRGRWSSISLRRILEDVSTKSTSTSLCDVVEFCLTDDSELVGDKFEPEFLFKCIDEVYEPIRKWYQTELADPTWYESLARRLGLDLSNYGWLELAFEHPQTEPRYIMPGSWPAEDEE
ncbi:hypothetical protein K458DRAFT_399127 [Lentithecium fluviatile CBS 122367]|uniref:Prion-inhibition and propagation HeLo domain-containing protein n=1 Tax=Lentithecium fluviatile CBS 122367 TaxID=1168545 RepID=A0A6G1JKZ6_9PLEO|nr:hypothetical protein K458DRAFT_399127 [Lentithecium fluviatile CBS 122367]